MDFTPHQLVKCVIDKPMTSQSRFAGEFGGNNKQTIVPATTFGACVTGVFGRVVDQFELQGVEPGQPLAQDGFNPGWRGLLSGRLFHAGKTFLNGLTLTLA